ncbi:hypothetical protein A2643_03595 [Candidatus Nomurabacteria bacterium RIFCSPHIGHO2_01_FULL_39_220]|nr:MAG: hypothetical protein A2643_03595 [Candidatus Nomurabacteria bacterium RIFCSPHIGHO2_01_FULL_39_220]OGI72731.1 MAG: hypothetical protein A2W56_02835 [Candidatus Nomurabacteria bacterium RIFCSPHIGHO2_02_41_18]
MIGLNSRQTQTPPRFSTLRVANPCRIRILWGECRTDGASRRPYFWRKFEFRILAVYLGQSSKLFRAKSK